MRSYFSLLGILRLIATLPLFVIFLISSWYLIFQYNLGMNLKELRHEFSIALDLANLSKELDKEMIINDTNSKNVNRQITDHTIEHIKQLHSNELGLSEILNRLESLPQIRYTLDDANLNNSEVLSYFRDLNLLIKNEIFNLRDHDLSNRLNLFIFTFISSYSNSISISAKRDLVANIINHRALNTQELLLWLDLIRNNGLNYGYLPDSYAKKQIETIFKSQNYKQK